MKNIFKDVYDNFDISFCEIIFNLMLYVIKYQITVYIKTKIKCKNRPAVIFFLLFITLWNVFTIFSSFSIICDTVNWKNMLMRSSKFVQYYVSDVVVFDRMCNIVRSSYYHYDLDIHNNIIIYAILLLLWFRSKAIQCSEYNDLNRVNRMWINPLRSKASVAVYIVVIVYIPNTLLRVRCLW